jgi:hypothetical protein
LKDPNELKRLQFADIESIESISNPGAKYDAEGRAVIIIKTKQNEENGWAIHAFEQLMHGKYFNNENDVGLSYVVRNI